MILHGVNRQASVSGQSRGKETNVPVEAVPGASVPATMTLAKASVKVPQHAAIETLDNLIAKKK